MAKTALERIEAAEERIDGIEGLVKQMYGALGKTFGVVQGGMDELEETVSAVISVVGLDKVQEAIVAQRRIAEEKKTEARKGQLAADVTSGQIAPALLIGENSIVVGTEVTPEGQPVGYVDGRVQFRVSEIAPDVREKLTGKSVGESIDTTGGGKFTIAEIYDQVQPASEPASEGGAESTDQSPSS